MRRGLARRDSGQTALSQPFERLLSERHRRRESRRTDAAEPHITEISLVTELVLGVLGRGAQAGVHGGALLHPERRNDAAPLPKQTAEPASGRAGRGLVVEVF